MGLRLRLEVPPPDELIEYDETIGEIISDIWESEPQCRFTHVSTTDWFHETGNVYWMPGRTLVQQYEEEGWTYNYLEGENWITELYDRGYSDEFAHDGMLSHREEGELFTDRRGDLWGYEASFQYGDPYCEEYTYYHGPNPPQTTSYCSDMDGSDDDDGGGAVPD